MQMTDREKLQHDIKSAKETIELAKALDNLRNNKDFKKLILNHFCKDEVVRLSTLSADLALDETGRADTLDTIQHHGYLSVWFRILDRKADVALGSLAENEETLEELSGEDFNEGESPYLTTEAGA